MIAGEYGVGDEGRSCFGHGHRGSFWSVVDIQPEIGKAAGRYDHRPEVVAAMGQSNAIMGSQHGDDLDDNDVR